MRRLILIFTLWTLSQAKPELYREKEDFKYSRSSSDDGQKSGFYGAQRGNMGGNFERSHNMDSLAQHQMSGLVKQVEGELGDSSKAKAGNVFTSANSRGIYGSGTYDLSNLEGRNFDEGTTFYDAQSQNEYGGHSSHSSQAISQSSQQSDRRSQSSGYGGYQYRGQAGQALQIDDQQSIDLSGGRYGSETGSSRYSQSGHNAQTQYRGNSESQLRGNDYRSSDQFRSRLTGGAQSTIILRPGTRVSIPVAVHSSYDQRSDAETLGNSDHRTGYTSSGNPKYYESSSSYRKEWEKQDSRPVAVPLAVPTMPTQGELYDDTQRAQISDKQFEGLRTNSQSSHGYSGYNANAQISTSSQSRHQSDYSSQRQGVTGFHTDETSGSEDHSGNLVGETSSKPKSYQSSYSYHKAWERQGDPYVIIPNTKTGDDRASQRLTSAYDQSYGRSQSRQSSTGYSHGCSIQCDENSHLRVTRSVDYNPGEDSYPNQDFDIGQEEMGQQVQSEWGNADFGQQSQNEWQQLEDLGQQTQSKWDILFGQQPQNTDKLINFEQQSEAKNDNMENFEQQSQNSWDKVETPILKSTISDESAQNTQQHNKVTESKIQQKEHLEDLGQNLQTEREKFGVHFSGKNDKRDQFEQQSMENLQENIQTQQAQDGWHDIQHFGQQSHNIWDQSDDIRQQTWGKNMPNQAVDFKDYSQQTQDATSLQQTENISNPLKPVWEQSQDELKVSSEDRIHHWGNVHGHNFQQTQYFSNVNNSSNRMSSVQNTYREDVSHSRDSQSQSHGLQDLWGMIENFEKETSGHKDETSGPANTQKSHFDWSQMEAHTSINNLSSSQNPQQHKSDNNSQIPAFEGQSKKNSDTRPSHESSRGDISDVDETSLSFTTEKINLAQNQDSSQVKVFKSETDYKTPEVIDSLSLKENITSSNMVDQQNSGTVQQKSDSTLSVLSLQDWLSQEKQHESSLQYKPKEPTVNIKPHDRVPDQKPYTPESQEKILEQAPEEIQQSEQGFDLRQKTENLDQQVEGTWSIPELQKSKQTTQDKIEDLGQVQEFGQQVQNTWENSEALGQKTDSAWGNSNDFGQQVQSNWGKLEDLGQKAQTAWDSSDDLGQQVQINWEQSEDLGQKAQTAWDDSDDLGQQVQTSWQPSDTVQHSESQQQMQNFRSRSRSEDHATNFYDQKYPENYRTPIASVNEGIEHHKVQDLQVPHVLGTTISTSTEAVTEKPGFWRGVGNKLSNAKETVYSWFRRSE